MSYWYVCASPQLRSCLDFFLLLLTLNSVPDLTRARALIKNATMAWLCLYCV